MKETFAGKVRAACREMGRGGREFEVKKLALKKLDLLGHREVHPVHRVMADFFKAGEVERVRPGVYRLAGRKDKPPEYQEIMWRLVRSRRTVTVDDLVELTSDGTRPGCSADYVREWLQMLVKRGVLRINSKPPGEPGSWTLIEEPPEGQPRNDEKAQRLRALRAEKRKAAMELAQAAFDCAYRSIIEAKMHLNDLARDEDEG